MPTASIRFFIAARSTNCLEWPSARRADSLLQLAKQHPTHHRTWVRTEDPAFQFYCYGEPSPKATAAGLTMIS
jgi:hypothetical protein